MAPVFESERGPALPDAEADPRCAGCDLCEGACPVPIEMGMTPREVLGAVARGRGQLLLTSPAVWQCLRCLACSDVCPRGLDPASVIDELRAEALARSAVPEDPVSRAAYQLHRRVLEQIVLRGRLDVCGFIVAGDNGGGRAVAPDKGIALAFKGKLGILRALLRRLTGRRPGSRRRAE